MNSFKPLLYTLSIFTLTSCQSLTFSKKQKDFATQMSSTLHGARVTLGKTVTSSTSEGNFNVFQIDIEELPIDSTNTIFSFASSIPAYIFYRDTIADRKEYKYIYVVVKTNGKAQTFRYTPDQLQQVEACFISLAGYIRAMKEQDSDSLSYYSDPALIKKFPLTPFIDDEKKTNEKWGPVQDYITNGFRFDEDEKTGKRYIHFFSSLRRSSTYQALELWIDPETKKVIGYDM